MAPHRNFLSAQNLSDGFGPPGACFYSCVVGDDDYAAPGYGADDCDHTRGRSLAVVLIVGDKQTDFTEIRVRIEQQRDALACRQFSLLVLPLDTFRTATLFDRLFNCFQFVEQTFKMPAVL